MPNNENKKNCVSSMILGIVGTIFAMFVPAVAYSCSVPGLILGIKKRKTHKSTAGIALNIVAISLAAINSVCGILMTIKMFCSDKNKEDTAEKPEE